jgi:D-3-phosphoglycerate dehydrogenase
MRIIGTDPYVSKQWAEDMNIELVPLEELLAQSDYVSLHVALTPETKNLLSTEQFAQMKDGARIVNCARGGIVDEAALFEAMKAGKVAGAGLDVFATEPPEGNPILESDGLVATPHIGGSTGEAQEIVGIRIAEQVVQYLREGVAINSVNMPSVSPEQYKLLGPYVDLAERLGAFAAQMASGNPQTVRLVYFGDIGASDTKLIRNGGLGGVLNSFLSQKVNVVNAMQIAKQRGLAVGERHEKRNGHTDSIRLELETDAGVTTVEGAVVLGNPRLIQVDGIYCEATLSGNVMFMKNKDVPGVIGHVGTVLGDNKINIANFSLGRENEPSVPGESLRAVAVVETDGPVPEKALAELRELHAVLLARNVVLG